MTLADPVALSVLVAAAAGTGVVHTLAGPDHYLPLIAAAKAGGWSGRRTLLSTGFAGLLHCAASALLVPVALLAAQGAASLAGLQELRGDLSAWLLIGLGLTFVLAAWRRLHRGELAPARGLRGWLLLAFALGPCEWLLPNALVAADAQGIAGEMLVIAVFTACTMATMLLCVAAGVRLLPVAAARSRAMQFAPGAAMAVCGSLILAGL